MKKTVFILIGSILILWLLGGILPVQTQKAKATTLSLETQVSGEKDVMLSWEKIDEAKKYIVERDSTKIATVSKESYKDTNVSEGDYTYTINAPDSADKEIASSSITITKTASGLTTKPSTVSLADVPSVKDIVFPGSKFKDLPDFVQGVINWLFGLAGAFAVIAIVYSGIMYITSGADQTKTETAKKNLVWAINGLVIRLLTTTTVNLP